MQDFRKLDVWKKGHALALDVYRLTAGFPRHEAFGMTAQLRRAAVSVPTNVAEGAKRRWGGDYARFLNVAEASLAEARYLLLLARDLRYVSARAAERAGAEADEVARMLHGLRVRVEADL